MGPSFIIHLLSPIHLCLSTFVYRGQDCLDCPLKGWSAVSLLLGWAVARRGLEARGSFPFLIQSLWQEEILLPLAFVPLLVLKAVLSAEQELQGLQEGAGETPELALWGLSLHKFNVQLEG